MVIVFPEESSGVRARLLAKATTRIEDPLWIYSGAKDLSTHDL